MTGTVLLAFLGVWLLLSVVTAVACAALVRGGLDEDRARGYAPPREITRTRGPAGHG